VSLVPERDRPLAPLTSLKLGGPARYFVEAMTRADIQASLQWARDAGLPLAILGGGSNLVVGDAGFPGLVVRIATRGITLHDEGQTTLVRVEAGEPWQSVVDTALAHDLSGLECLTGIPGSAGATPIQNVGAYGQEISDTLLEVEVLERATGRVLTFDNQACAFGYRDSRFRRHLDRYVVLGVSFRLEKFGSPMLRYTELSRALASQPNPSLKDVAKVVWSLRKAKSMILDPRDPNGCNAGSFFKNPIVNEADAERVRALCVAQGIVAEEREVPCFAAPAGKVKLAAGFLIERAGIQRGMRRGAVGVSTRHALCLVHHGGAQTRDLMALAREIQQAVQTRFGITLEPEPVCW
jgi:UDP-N-acetylmuramate dehydrogenase